jgi:hypothetical protein
MANWRALRADDVQVGLVIRESPSASPELFADSVITKVDTSEGAGEDAMVSLARPMVYASVAHEAHYAHVEAFRTSVGRLIQAGYTVLEDRGGVPRTMLL